MVRNGNGLQNSALLTLAATVLLLGVTTAVRAELAISTANQAAGFAVGTTFSDDHVFDLKENAEIRLLRSPSGAQFEMRGPFKGTLEKFNSDCKGWLAFTHSYCKSQSAGDQLPVGGTRGPTN